MKVITIIFLVALTMASAITLVMKNITYEERQKTSFELPSDDLSTNNGRNLFMPSKRVSRFLSQNGNKNPRAADHCHKDKEICKLEGGYNSTCCNNKCVDLWEDHDNCGACKNKCEFTQACCSGKCVYLSYDKGHCGTCSNECNEGRLCVYGMCDYP